MVVSYQRNSTSLLRDQFRRVFLSVKTRCCKHGTSVQPSKDKSIPLHPSKTTVWRFLTYPTILETDSNSSKSSSQIFWVIMNPKVTQQQSDWEWYYSGSKLVPAKVFAALREIQSLVASWPGSSERILSGGPVQSPGEKTQDSEVQLPNLQMLATQPAPCL